MSPNDVQKLLDRIDIEEFDFRSACEYIMENGDRSYLHDVYVFLSEIVEYMDATIKMATKMQAGE
jgi:hypothetical protein